MINIVKLKQLMKEKGLKIQYVCDKLGASRYKIYDWERGKSTPSENELETLALMLGTTVDYLTDKTDIKEQKNKPTAESDEPKDLMDILREQEGLMFNGVPISEEDKESVIAAIKLATEIAKKSRNQ